MQGDFRLGDWLVQPALCRLSKDGRTVQVRAKVMDLLAYLAGRPGEVIPKERLLDDVWGSQAISESALTRTVTELRQALGDDAAQPRLLETIPKRGYRLIGPVAPVPETANAPAPGTGAPSEHSTGGRCSRRERLPSRCSSALRHGSGAAAARMCSPSRSPCCLSRISGTILSMSTWPTASPKTPPRRSA